MILHTPQNTLQCKRLKTQSQKDVKDVEDVALVFWFGVTAISWSLVYVKACCLENTLHTLHIHLAVFFHGLAEGDVRNPTPFAFPISSTIAESSEPR